MTAQIGMLFATIGLVLVSVLTASITYCLLRSQVDPHVIVYTKHDVDRSSVLMIVIENIGAGVAHNVRFKASRPIPSKAWGFGGPNDPSAEEMEEGPLITG